jgi:hypothetical protein
MSATILILVDGDNLDWVAHRRRARAGRAVLVPLGISAAAYERAHQPTLARYDVEVWNAGAAAIEAREAVQARYPEFVYELARTPVAGGGSLLERLAWGDVNLWWFIETSEKSVFRCSLVNHVYFLELVSRAVACITATELWVSVRDRDLRRTLEAMSVVPAIRSCARAADRLRPRLPFVARLLARRLVLASRLLGQYAILRATGLGRDFRSARIVLHANYPSMWIRGLGERSQDRHYGVLAGVLNRWKPTGYLVHLQLPSWQLWRRRRRIAAIWRELNIAPLVQFAGLAGVCDGLAPPLLWRLAATRRAVGRHRRWTYGAWDVSAIVEKELDGALEHNELALDLFWLRGLRAVFARQRVDFVVHSGEFQPFEKAIWYAAREHRVSAVSFQHSTSGPMFLSYHFAAGEIGTYLKNAGDPSSMPLPALFATTGEYAAEAMVRAGFPPERVRVCGPIRYHGLINLRSQRPSPAEARRSLALDAAGPVILVATTSKHPDNLNMMHALAGALQERREPAVVVFKAHPQVTEAAERELVAIGEQLRAPVRWHRFAEEQPLSALLVAANVLVTNSSATGVEAMALDVVPIFFHNPYLYDLSILYSVPDSVLFATTRDELQSALEDALSGRATQRLRPHWIEDARRLFGPLDTRAEQRFLAFMQEAAAAPRADRPPAVA